MTHVYLNETAITEALKAHAITKREAQELVHQLKSCQKRLLQKRRSQDKLAS